MTDSYPDDLPEDDPEWGHFSDSDIVDLTDEVLGRAGNERQRAMKYVERRLPILMERIYNLATANGVPPKIQLDAAKYLVDRVMGRAPLYVHNGNANEGAPWEKVFSATVIEEPSRKELGPGTSSS